MITIKQINKENRPYYIFNDTINIKHFDPKLFSMDKMSFKNIDVVIYNIKYITIKSLNHIDIVSANSFYIIFNNVGGHISKESNEYKYLNFASTDKNKEVLEKYTELLDKIKK